MAGMIKESSCGQLRTGADVDLERVYITTNKHLQSGAPFLHFCAVGNGNVI